MRDDKEPRQLNSVRNFELEIKKHMNEVSKNNELDKLLNESLILAQDERWRRA